MGERTAEVENWRAVPGYEGAYEASDLGRVRSLDRLVSTGNGGARTSHGRLLKQNLMPDGYLSVNLCRDGSYRTAKVHRLVLETFVGPCPASMVCLHGDDDPRNNRLGNLRWGTHRQNMQDALANNRNSRQKRTHCPRGHALQMPNLVANKYKSSGQRTCLACARAHAANQRAKARGYEVDLQDAADWYHARIMASGASPDTPAPTR